MAKRKINWQLVDRLILKYKRMRHPQHIDMRHWGIQDDCGTVACIAGTGLLEAHEVTPKGLVRLAQQTESGEEFNVFRHGDRRNAVYLRAKEVFGLREEEADKLFFLSKWPSDLYYKYIAAEQGKERRDVMVERLERFKATKGAE